MCLPTHSLEHKVRASSKAITEPCKYMSRALERALMPHFLWSNLLQLVKPRLVAHRVLHYDWFIHVIVRMRFVLVIRLCVRVFGYVLNGYTRQEWEFQSSRFRSLINKGFCVERWSRLIFKQLWLIFRFDVKGISKTSLWNLRMSWWMNRNVGMREGQMFARYRSVHS